MHCFACGNSIPKGEPLRRREVLVGSSEGSRGSTHYFRKRVVCPECAAKLDRKRRWLLPVQLALLILFVWGAPKVIEAFVGRLKFGSPGAVPAVRPESASPNAQALH